MYCADTNAMSKVDLALQSIQGFDYLGALRRVNGNKEIYFKLIVMFFSTTHLEEIHRAFYENNEIHARGQAHALKGAALNMGFNRIAELVDLFGTLLKSNQTDFAGVCLAELEKEFAMARELAHAAIHME